jgi:DNA-directed RNA polymerase specialized sigma subunit
LTAAQRDEAAKFFRFARAIARTFGRTEDQRDEFESIAMEEVCHAVRDFDPTQGTQLSTWVCQRIQWAFRSEIRQSARHRARFDRHKAHFARDVATEADRDIERIDASMDLADIAARAGVRPRDLEIALAREAGVSVLDCRARFAMQTLDRVTMVHRSTIKVLADAARE